MEDEVAHHGLYEDPAKTLKRNQEREARQRKNKAEDIKSDLAMARRGRGSI
jgi:hypothetical protein